MIEQNYGQRWHTIRGRMLTTYVEVWRTAEKIELMTLYDFEHPKAPCRQVFDVPLSDIANSYFAAFLD